MRYNKTYHQRADRLAKAHSYEFAIYMGHYNTKNNKWLAFIPKENDTLCRKTGLLKYILINEKQTLWQSTTRFDLPFLNYDYLKKGRQLFRELEYKYFQSIQNPNIVVDFYWRELYAIVKLNMYDYLISKNDMCLFLQESERLGRKIEIVQIEETTHQCDGWKYCLRLVDLFQA